MYKTFIRPHLEYAIQATHPILCRDAEAQEKVQKFDLKFVKGLRHVPYEAALKQLRLFSLTHRRIRGGLIAIFKITHDLLEFPMASTFHWVLSSTKNPQPRLGPQKNQNGTLAEGALLMENLLAQRACAR